MKKLIVKLIGSLLLLVMIVAVLTTCVGLIWGYCVPRGFAVGAVAQKEVQEYLVAQMPELKGAEASEVSFDADGIYHVYYGGKTFIANDATVQNNIGAFMNKYSSFDFRSKIVSRSLLLTLVGITGWSICMVTCITSIIKYSSEIRKEKRNKVAQVVETVT